MWLVPEEAREAMRSGSLELMISGKLPCGCQKPNLGPLREELFLTT